VEREGIDGGAVVIQNLRKQYPGATKAAVVQLTLRMEYGEVFGLLGPNGAGIRKWPFIDIHGSRDLQVTGSWK
jgi:ABC-type lipopolysaccharide export system ATPase subunit